MSSAEAASPDHRAAGDAEKKDDDVKK